MDVEGTVMNGVRKEGDSQVAELGSSHELKLRFD